MKKVMAITLTALLSLSWMAGCTSNSQPENAAGGSEASQMDQTATSAGDALLPRIVLFGGRTYMDINFDSASISKEMIGEEIGTSSKFLGYDKDVDETQFTEDFVNRIGEDAVFYSMKDYDPAFRILAEAEGRYYICENIDTVATHLLDHKEQIQAGTIRSYFADTVSKQLEQEETIQLLELFANTNKTPSKEGDEERAQAFREGKAYYFEVIFQDQTTTGFVTIPSLNLVVMGVDDYTSDSLGSDVAFLFDGIPQITEQQGVEQSSRDPLEPMD